MVNEPLGRSLVFTGKAIRDAFEATLSRHGGSLGTWVVLSALSDLDFVSQSALASHVQLEGATITHHVDRLEAAGLVRRVVDPDDRRVRRLELTDAGAVLHRDLLEATLALERRVLAGLSADELGALAQVLGTIHDNLSRLDDAVREAP